jgi:hypothetical protein
MYPRDEKLFTHDDYGQKERAGLTFPPVPLNNPPQYSELENCKNDKFTLFNSFISNGSVDLIQSIVDRIQSLLEYTLND